MIDILRNSYAVVFVVVVNHRYFLREDKRKESMHTLLNGKKEKGKLCESVILDDEKYTWQQGQQGLTFACKVNIRKWLCSLLSVTPPPRRFVS